MTRYRAMLMTSLIALMAPGNLVYAQTARSDAGRLTLPIPLPARETIGDPDAAKTSPVYPRLPTAPAGAPNIIVILTDDAGFGAASTFGGPIPTPNLDRLAARGLLYNRFHTTAMCSPTRAALLTGRNHHVVGTGALTDFASGYDGYTGIIPRDSATIAQVLKDNGYSTAFVGKHHNVPIGQNSPAGPFDQWPLGLGFDHFFGFVGAATDQWRPNLYRDNSPVPDAPIGDVLDKRLADDAVNWIHAQKAAAPDKPFFLYFAPGSVHTPLQAPADWIARFKGKFSAGYEAVRAKTLARQKRLGLVPANARLAQWPEDVPRWGALNADQRRIQQAYIETFAAMLAYQDAQFGHMLDELDRMGLTDNTLIAFIEGDNGADSAGSPEGKLSESGEIANRHTTDAEKLAALPTFGGPDAAILYSTGWALAMNAPFPQYKQVASHLGGVRNGLILSWPAGIKARGMRDQYAHVIDVAPTILAAAKVPEPETVAGVSQRPMDGIALQYSFATPDAPSRRVTQHYEMLGNRAIYHDGWLAATTPRKKPWDMVTGADAADNLALSYSWELYDLTRDFTQSRDLAKRYPVRLAEMKTLFDQEAKRNGVYPLDDRTAFNRMSAFSSAMVKKQDRYVYFGKGMTLSHDVWPSIFNRGFTIDADIRIDPAQGAGVIAAVGSAMGGWSFFLKDGIPHVAHAYAPVAADQTDVAGSQPVPVGKTTHLRFAFDYAGGGAGKGGDIIIFINGKEVGRGHLDRSIRGHANTNETFDIGLDSSVPVSPLTTGNGAFAGNIEKVEVTLGKMSEPGFPRK